MQRRSDSDREDDWPPVLASLPGLRLLGRVDHGS
jgi:hypothetical protein